IGDPGEPGRAVIEGDRGMIRPGRPRWAAAGEWAAGFLDVAGIALWLVAVSNVLSRHPWVFMLLGFVASVLEAGAIGLAAIAWSSSPGPRLRTICLVLGGALPPTIIVLLAIVEALVYTLV